MNRETDYGITQEFLNEYYEYKNGKLYFNSNNPWNKIGRLAQYDKGRNYGTSIDGIYFQTSRLIYIMHYGNIPDNYYVSHIDGNSKNDLIENLELKIHKKYTK